MKTSPAFFTLGISFASGLPLLGLVFAVATASLASAQEESAAASAEALLAGTLADGQILQVIRVLNQMEMEQAKLANKESSSVEIKTDAQMIITDHASSNTMIDIIVESGIELADSDLSQALTMQAEQTKEQLEELSAMDFDCAYIHRQLEQHELSFHTISTVLIPKAVAPVVKEFLALTAPKMEQHLHAARKTTAGLTQCDTAGSGAGVNAAEGL